MGNCPTEGRNTDDEKGKGKLTRFLLSQHSAFPIVGLISFAINHQIKYIDLVDVIIFFTLICHFYAFCLPEKQIE